VYEATAPMFEEVLLSVYSLLRVAERRQRLFALTLHLRWLPWRGHSVRNVSAPLALLRSLSPFPIVFRAGYCPISWFAPWAAAHRSPDSLTNLAYLLVRLYHPRVLTEEYIFHVDSDTQWGRDFRPELHALVTRRPGRPIYACRDCSAYRPDPPSGFAAYIRERGFPAECYANDGVFIMRNNLSDIEPRRARAIEIFNRFGGIWPDQDVFNNMYSCSEKELIPPEWNNHCHCLDSIYGRKVAWEEAIIHHGHGLRAPGLEEDWKRDLQEWKDKHKDVWEEVDENGAPLQEPLEPSLMVNSSWWVP
jgi:hypothetical protein